MKFVKKIVHNGLEYKYTELKRGFLGNWDMFLVLGDTDSGDYEEILKLDSNFRKREIKGVHYLAGSAEWVFLAYTRLEALIDDCLVSSGNEYNEAYSVVSMYGGVPRTWNPMVLNSFVHDVEFEETTIYVSIAEWLVKCADSSVFYPDQHSIVFKWRYDMAHTYKISDRGLTYIAKARLLG